MTRRESGKSRLITYLVEHVAEWQHNQTLRVATGLDDVTRTIRELRRSGWDIDVRRDGHYKLNSVIVGTPRGSRGSISLKTRYLVLHRGNFRCRACGRGTDDGVTLVIDHVVPVDWGGTSDLENLQALCAECNQGKQAWVADLPPDTMRDIFNQPTVERRIEALFEHLPNQEVPSLLIQLASGNALDWQRALRRVRKRSGKTIVPTADRRGYRYLT